MLDFLFSALLLVPFALFCLGFAAAIQVTWERRKLRRQLREREPQIWEEIAGSVFWYNLLGAKVSNGKVADRVVLKTVEEFSRKERQSRWAIGVAILGFALLMLLFYCS